MQQMYMLGGHNQSEDNHTSNFSYMTQIHSYASE
jgi:hypothetical protein